jgi:lipopolysaccharide biosynthesis regulator YciM
MLDIPKRFPGSVVAACDECRANVRIDAASLDDARAKLKAANWYEAARAGKGPKGAHWHCPSCNPLLKSPSESRGPSVGIGGLRLPEG